MRTDSTHLSRKFAGARSVISKLYGKKITQKMNHYKTKVRNAQEAHEALDLLNGSLKT